MMAKAGKAVKAMDIHPMRQPTNGIRTKDMEGKVITNGGKVHGVAATYAVETIMPHSVPTTPTMLNK